jgi:hypothetical protein
VLERELYDVTSCFFVEDGSWKGTGRRGRGNH